MICILRLIYLTSCVCGTFVVNVTQSSYQAEENGNITLEWMFTTKPDSSTDFLFIFCNTFTDRKVLFHLRGGVEVPESQDKQFAGRVQCVTDVLGEGRIRLQVSRLTTNDSGLYRCEVVTKYDGNFGECWLSVTAERDWPEPQTRATASRGRIVLYCALGLTAAAVLVFLIVYLLSPAKRISNQVCNGRATTATV